jgi:glycosyltransferase involved in cell wall biosynthesis
LEKRAGDPSGLEIVEVPMSQNYRRDKYSFTKRRRHEVEYGVELAALVGRVKPDIVISGNTPSEPQWAMISRANRLKIPVVSWVQDFYSLAVTKLVRKKAPVLGWAAAAWYDYIDGRCLRASAGVVVITKDFVPIVRGFRVPQERIEVIPNWAPLDEITPKPKANPWATAHGLADKFVYLYSGTLAMKHNPDLLRQLCVATRGSPEIRVVVISEGPGMDFLQQAKAEEGLQNLVLLPYQPFSVMSDVLGTADVLVAILEADAGVFSVPSKVLIYHAAGRPILGAMPPENLAAKIVHEQHTGICMPPNDTEAFLKAALVMKNDASSHSHMAANARNYAEQEFDIQQVANRFESVFRRVLADEARLG